MPSAQASIVVEGLTKSFGSSPALERVSFSVPQGTVLGLLGPNGAGKTTVVRILATLLKADEGWAYVGGHEVMRHPREVRRLIGLTGQYAAVDELLSAPKTCT
jgi:ABC-type multidrug transport system ATPase subunit